MDVGTTNRSFIMVPNVHIHSSYVDVHVLEETDVKNKCLTHLGTFSISYFSE